MKYKKKADVAFTKSSTYKGSILLGETTEDQFKILEKALAEVPQLGYPIDIHKYVVIR